MVSYRHGSVGPATTAPCWKTTCSVRREPFRPLPDRLFSRVHLHTVCIATFEIWLQKWTLILLIFITPTVANGPDRCTVSTLDLRADTVALPGHLERVS